MIRIGGRDYPTLAEAAIELGVSGKTVREWIKRGIIEPPPQLVYGLRLIAYFPQDYLERARLAVERYRSQGPGGPSRTPAHDLGTEGPQG